MQTLLAAAIPTLVYSQSTTQRNVVSFKNTGSTTMFVRENAAGQNEQAFFSYGTMVAAGTVVEIEVRRPGTIYAYSANAVSVDVVLNATSHFKSASFDYTKLTRFWQALSNLGTGGVDVLIIGDSISRGLTTTNPDTNSYAHVLRGRLQTAWNPAGVVGGSGFLPAKWAWSSPPTQPFTVSGGAAYYDRLMSGAGNVIARINASSGHTIAWTGSGVTDIDAVHQVNGGSNVTAGWATGAGSGTILSQGNSGTTLYGVHTQASTGLTPGTTYTWTLSAPGSGDLRFSGIIRYNGDYGKGIRVQNLSCSGILCYDPASSSGYYRGDDLPGTGANTAAVLQANIDNFTSLAFTDTTSAGAKRGALVAVALGTNDQGTYGNADDATALTGLATLTNYYGLMADYIVARPSAPAVVFIIPPAPGSSRETRYRTMVVAAAQAVAATRPHVTVLDLDQRLGQRARASLPVGFDGGDLLHISDEAHQWIGDEIADALLKGRAAAIDAGIAVPA